MNPNVKKGIIITSVAAICVGGFIGVKLYLDSSKTIEVNSVASLNTGYWSSPYSSSGLVTNSDTQSVYYDSTKTITQVFVSEGQSVSAGEKLLQYDLTSLQSTVELDQIAIDKANNDLTLANYELKKLLNTSPAPSPTPTPIPTPTPKPSAVPINDVPKKDSDGNYPYIVSLSQCEKDVISYVVYYTKVTDDGFSEVHPPENGPNADTSWQIYTDQQIESEYGYTYYYWIMHSYTDGTSDTYSKDSTKSFNKSSDLQETLQKEYVVGSRKHPYTFNLVDSESTNAYVYGKLFLDNVENDDYYEFNLYELDDDNNLEVTSSWKVKASSFAKNVSNAGNKYYLSTHTEEDREYIYPDEEKPIEDDDIDYSGYSANELAIMIRDKKLELKKLDLNLRKAKLQLKEDQELLNDGTVYAKRNGVVKKVSEIDNPPQDGSAFLEVTGGNGYYIEGTISEIMLDTIKKGDSISCYSWTSGNNYTATIESIDDYPSDSGYYNGTGNPNVSYYGFSAYVDDESSELTLGDYLEITFDGSTQEDLNNEIWLSGAYVRKEGNQYYVWKENNGVLEKQYVTVGNIVYSTYQIKSGLNDTDYIAFAYSKNAKEGTKTSNVEEVVYD